MHNKISTKNSLKCRWNFVFIFPVTYIHSDETWVHPKNYLKVEKHT